MTFKKIDKTAALPPRYWCLVGYPGSGKSTFLMQMKAPILPIDADHRISEVVGLAEGDVYSLSDEPADAVDVERIYKLLKENMPGSGVKTIGVDSLTTIITPKVVQAVMDNDAGRNKNRMAGFKDKALSMRLLQDAVTMWGCDVLWIYHLQDSRDEQAKAVTKATLSATERARLYRSINLELHIIQDEKNHRRGVKVVWARRGRSGMIIWDNTGKWAGMPEKIEETVYGGLTKQEMDRIEESAPATFATEEAAIEYGLSQSAFKALQHSKNAFGKLKREHADLGLEELSILWIEDVERRVNEAKGENGNGERKGFTKLDDLLYQISKDFGITEAEAKAKLKEVGVTTWPRDEGEARKRSLEAHNKISALIELEILNQAASVAIAINNAMAETEEQPEAEPAAAGDEAPVESVEDEIPFE